MKKFKNNEYRISDLCDIIGGGTPKTSNSSYWDGSIPWITIKDIQSASKYIKNTEKSITKKGLNNSSTHLLEPEDIIISARGTVGEIAMIESNMAFNQSCFALRSRMIDPQFLYYSLKNKVNEVKTKTHGTVFNTIIRKTFDEITINVPEEEVQKKISQLLSLLDQAIDVITKINRNLEEQLKLIFKNKFIFQNRKLTKGTLSEFVITFKGGDWGKVEETNDYNKKVYCVRGADIPDLQYGFLNKTPNRFLTERKLNNKILKPGNIVIEASGGSPTQSTGRCFLVTSDFLNKIKYKLICSNFCKFLTIKPNYEYYVYYYLRFLYDSKILFSFENGTTGIKNLNIKRLLTDWEIIIPDKEELKEFNNTALLFHKMIMENSNEIDKLISLRDFLLPKLISGQIDISDLDI